MSFTKSSENITPTRKEVYQALLRSLKRRKGFGIVFVQCSTAETASIIQRIQQDLPQKKFGVLSLPPPINKRDIFSNKTPPVDNLYDIVANFPERKNLNILLIQGLEKSLQPYIKPGYGGDGDYYNLDTVPPILSHLNQRRDKFRDNFNNICFVFILPFFAIKYFIRRAPDFFDWSAGVFAIESEQLEQKSNQTYNIGNIFLSLGEIEQAIAFYQQSLAISQEIQDRPGEEISLGGLGNAYNSLGQYEKAIDFYEQSLAISREIRNREGEAAYLIGLGNAFYSLAEFERAITFYEQSLVISQEIQDHQGVENSLKSLGNAYYSLGLDEKAIDFYEQSLAISQEIKDRQREVVSLGFLGNAYLSQGQFERAINFYQQSLAISREIKDPQRDATSLIGLGNAYSSLGQFERAIAVYEHSLAISRGIGDHQGKVNSLENLSNAYQSLGEYERAIWQLLRSKAQSHPSWLQFLTESEMASVQRRTRKLMLPISSEKIKLKIPVNQSLWMVIDLPFQNYQLLLLNRSQQGQALLCPSSAYAPNSIVDKSPILLPQKYAWASDSEEKFVFGEVGNEEFLAIVLQKPLSLPWLTPSEDEALPEWNAERMKELFKQLEQQGNWQVFYQSFEVVEKQ